MAVRVFIGDPAVPAVCRLDHYDVPTSHPYPMGAGLMTQVVDLIPLPFAEPGGSGFIVGTMLPMLADALAKMAARFPATAARPVWAVIPEALVLALRTNFRPTGPGRVRTSARFIWMPRLSDARDDLAALRRDFADLTPAAAASILPLYQAAYSARMELEHVGGLLSAGP